MAGMAEMNRGTLRRRTGLAAVALFCAMVSSCVPQNGNPAGQDVIETTAERGPISVTARVRPAEIHVADTLELVLEARVEEGYEVEFPAPDGKLGPSDEDDASKSYFSVLGFSDQPAALLEGGRIVVARSFRLEPFLPGEYEIPPMTVQYWQADESERHVIETKPLVVPVRSVIGEGEGETTVRDIAPPVDMPGGWGIWIALATAAIVVAAGLIWWWRRPRRAKEVPVLAPHLLALRQLRELQAERLVEKGNIKLFHIRVSDVLRRYIENRFGVHAPERTTEEFLTTLGNDGTLGSSRPLLREFLNHCDLVKFAKHQPTTAESQDTFDTCRQFVVDTAASDAPDEPNPAQAATSKVGG